MVDLSESRLECKRTQPEIRELEQRFRLIINHYAKSQSNIRTERGHVYKPRVVAFDATLVSTTAKGHLENTKYK